MKNYLYKAIAGLILLVIMLTGCNSEPETYKKTVGEIVGKDDINGKFGTSYYLEVSYPVGENGTYAIDDVNVSEDEHKSYKEKDKVLVYYNKRGIGEIVSEDANNNGDKTKSKKKN